MSSQFSSECLLRSFVTESDDAIVCFQMDGSVVLWSPAAESLYGYSAQEVLGRNVSLTLPLYDIPLMQAILRNPGAPAGDTSQTVERLSRQGTRLSLRIQRSDPDLPRLTVSIGVAVYPGDGRSPQELLEIADRRLYQDKKSAGMPLRTVAAE